MKKYEAPIIQEEEIEVEDICFQSSGVKNDTYGNTFAGDYVDNSFWD